MDDIFCFFFYWIFIFFFRVQERQRGQRGFGEVWGFLLYSRVYILYFFMFLQLIFQEILGVLYLGLQVNLYIIGVYKICGEVLIWRMDGRKERKRIIGGRRDLFVQKIKFLFQSEIASGWKMIMVSFVYSSVFGGNVFCFKENKFVFCVFFEGIKRRRLVTLYFVINFQVVCFRYLCFGLFCFSVRNQDLIELGDLEIRWNFIGFRICIY